MIDIAIPGSYFASSHKYTTWITYLNGNGNGNGYISHDNDILLLKVGQPKLFLISFQ